MSCVELCEEPIELQSPCIYGTNQDLSEMANKTPTWRFFRPPFEEMDSLHRIG